MALFNDLAPDPAPSRRGRGWLGWGLLGFALAALIIIAMLPAPYVIERPGPVFDTLGDVEIDGEDVPMIQIPVEETYPTQGSLDMLTVNVSGSPSRPPSWFDIATAYVDPSKAILPMDLVYPPGTSLEDSNEQGRIDMENSQKEAIAAALTHLDYDFPSTLTVLDTATDSPADGVLEADDIITTVNGETPADVTELRALIAENGLDSAARVGIIRDGQAQTLSITPVMSDEAEPQPVVGIIVGSDFEFPFTVTIQLENVGGPSAGMMFALGIIDKLTEGPLTGGENIAGTGTITSTGEVGPIGGIVQKMWGAENAGADWFLAPSANCGEVDGHVPADLRVFSVETLDDALTALEAISSGEGLDELPTCSAP
ncbi:PDZ domain-containing protein [Microbacteriaceae bacterium SG_E_30_P1]|uniref:endopeptidase La n=1 Tax=Antiquaquibacter oligotrophicus TaxID=2880260 RepID=A0ABT6KKB2_9MICO|nr:S16 family serine protease [Antiquaquibacter oligotrophicus]MDH6180435.1 PDZ domain-containing protein [Antiquaquibacter oligotrophicus]UDF13827.1 PDZ domain-containing protein [Antiquaquibacter oligotrophicus]